MVCPSREGPKEDREGGAFPARPTGAGQTCPMWPGLPEGEASTADGHVASDAQAFL